MKNLYYFTDIHGQYDLFRIIVDYYTISDPECCLVFGGDACDRGPDGYHIMQELLNNPQIIYLKGNHEDLFVHAAYAMIGYCGQSDEMYAKLYSKQMTDEEITNLILSNTNSDITLYLYNGGLPTLVDWIKNGADERFVEKINNLPLTYSYKSFDFCHAGTNFETFQYIANVESNDKIDNMLIYSLNVQKVLWDRNMLPLGWETGRTCVFGHTPVVCLPTGIYGRDLSYEHIHPCAWQDKMGAKDKRGGWKIDMDTGATWTGRAYLLNCNTLEVIGFYDSFITTKNPANIIKIIETYKII